MRQNQNPRRSRGRINNGRNQGGKSAQDNNQQNRRGFSGSNRQFESQGPDGKNRGTATQLFERYTALSREVVASDRTLAEAFSQFADHYFRVAAEAGHDAPQAHRDNAQANVDANGNGDGQRPAREENQQGNNVNRNNVATDAATDGSASAGAGQVAQSDGAQPVVDGGAKEEGEGRWGNSRRRRAQNYREARTAAEDTAPKPAHAQAAEPAPTEAPSTLPAADADAAAVAAVKPRRRLTRSAPKEDKAAASEPAPAAPAEASEPVAAEVVKPRRGRPRKVVVTDETVA